MANLDLIRKLGKRQVVRAANGRAVYFGSAAWLRGEGPNVDGLRMARSTEAEQEISRDEFVKAIGRDGADQLAQVDAWAEGEEYYGR